MTEYDTSPITGPGKRDQRFNSQHLPPSARNRRALKKLRALYKHPKNPNFAVNKESVLQITCPVNSCRTPLNLVCPHCHHGSLTCNEQQLVLTCNICHSVVKDVYCANGHRINIAYIRQKQKQLKKLEQNSDGSSLLAVIGTFIGFGILLQFIVHFLSQWGY